ncbi:uncharacterized protein LY89DRAFT_733323 [Mollisia scopiformis]|uniref:Gfd2/YDR514C-like C-terminal domain-containing protein n=1 Tax=Mollisia scopiformis TaxID=149040 RepID=A0A194XBE2_MOLSC|nr:uncharacterized protein LY89DRAFT_733323 [Mollisia scopiformis]KUJ17474.1 hypothetical protein LY89DRAFT_733323 [Mollisia scopiformis]
MRILNGKLLRPTQYPRSALDVSSAGRVMTRLLQQSLGIPVSQVDTETIQQASVDPVFISIGCEFSTTAIREIGISILDTRHLRDLSVTSSSICDFQRAIQSYNFEFWKAKQKPISRAPRKTFIFGQSALVDKPELRLILHNFSRADAARELVVVGHGLGSDLKWLASEDFLLPDVKVLDTQAVATHLFPELKDRAVTRKGDEVDLNVRTGLGKLVDKLGIPHSERYFHNAGNDSNFTMRLLLMLAIQSTGETLQPTETDSKLLVLQAIANTPLIRVPKYDDMLFEQTITDEMFERRASYIDRLSSKIRRRGARRLRKLRGEDEIYEKQVHHIGHPVVRHSKLFKKPRRCKNRCARISEGWDEILARQALQVENDSSMARQREVRRLRLLRRPVRKLQRANLIARFILGELDPFEAPPETQAGTDNVLPKSPSSSTKSNTPSTPISLKSLVKSLPGLNLRDISSTTPDIQKIFSVAETLEVSPSDRKSDEAYHA